MTHDAPLLRGPKSINKKEKKEKKTNGTNGTNGTDGF
jgi:hypothetical protein